MFKVLQRWLSLRQELPMPIKLIDDSLGNSMQLYFDEPARNSIQIMYHGKHVKRTFELLLLRFIN